MKSEPNAYSIDDLERDGQTHWDGVRNYQARNIMRDDMRIGDRVLFYHSNAKPPHVAGLATISKEAYPDHTAWDPNDKHFDPKTDPDNPAWMMVDIAFSKRLNPVPLPALRANPALADMALLQPFQRLSVQPVSKEHYDEIVRMSNADDA